MEAEVIAGRNGTGGESVTRNEQPVIDGAWIMDYDPEMSKDMGHMTASDIEE